MMGGLEAGSRALQESLRVKGVRDVTVAVSRVRDLGSAPGIQQRMVLWSQWVVALANLQQGGMKASDLEEELVKAGQVPGERNAFDGLYEDGKRKGVTFREVFLRSRALEAVCVSLLTDPLPLVQRENADASSSSPPGYGPGGEVVVALDASWFGSREAFVCARLLESLILLCSAGKLDVGEDQRGGVSRLVWSLVVLGHMMHGDNVEGSHCGLKVLKESVAAAVREVSDDAEAEALDRTVWGLETALVDGRGKIEAGLGGADGGGGGVELSAVVEARGALFMLGERLRAVADEQRKRAARQERESKPSYDDIESETPRAVVGLESAALVNLSERQKVAEYASRAAAAAERLAEGVARAGEESERAGKEFEMRDAKARAKVRTLKEEEAELVAKLRELQGRILQAEAEVSGVQREFGRAASIAQEKYADVKGNAAVLEHQQVVARAEGKVLDGCKAVLDSCTSLAFGKRKERKAAADKVAAKARMAYVKHAAEAQEAASKQAAELVPKLGALGKEVSSKDQLDRRGQHASAREYAKAEAVVRCLCAAGRAVHQRTKFFVEGDDEDGGGAEGSDFSPEFCAAFDDLVKASEELEALESQVDGMVRPPRVSHHAALGRIKTEDALDVLAGSYNSASSHHGGGGGTGSESHSSTVLPVAAVDGYKAVSFARDLLLRYRFELFEAEVVDAEEEEAIAKFEQSQEKQTEQETRQLKLSSAFDPNVTSLNAADDGWNNDDWSSASGSDSDGDSVKSGSSSDYGDATLPKPDMAKAERERKEREEAEAKEAKEREESAAKAAMEKQAREEAEAKAKAAAAERERQAREEAEAEERAAASAAAAAAAEKERQAEEERNAAEAKLAALEVNSPDVDVPKSPKSEPKGKKGKKGKRPVEEPTAKNEESVVAQEPVFVQEEPAAVNEPDDDDDDDDLPPLDNEPPEGLDAMD